VTVQNQSAQKPRFVIFLHGGTYDKLYQAATIGLTAAAMGKEVYVFLMFWAIKKLALGELDRVDFSPAYEAHADEVARIMTERKVPKISEMFEEAKQVGSFKVIACSAGLEYMSVKYEDFASKVDDVMGLPLILNLAADAETTLFI
jgi:peroxiredoxin family protein